MANVQAEPEAGAVDENTQGWHGPILVNTWLIPEDDRWAALAEDFDVVGMGDSPESAIANMDELLLDYFELVAADGGSLADAVRRVPLDRRLRLHAGRVWGNLHVLVRQVRHVQRLPHEAPCPG